MLTKEEKIARIFKALDDYVERGGIEQRLKEQGISWGEFFAIRRADGRVAIRYEETQQDIAHQALHKREGIAESLLIDPTIDARRARVSADILERNAAKLHPERYGDRIQHDIQTVDLTGAIADARQRAAVVTDASWHALPGRQAIASSDDDPFS